jgi:hypothetical protein
MPSTYDKIATYTVVGSSTNSYTFTVIPATYTDLILVFNGKINSGSVNLTMQYNGDTGNNYSFTRIYGDGANAATSRASGIPDNYIGDIPSASWSNEIVSIQNYANTTTYKVGQSRSNAIGGAVQAWAHLWASTAAINAIRVYPSGGSNYTAGTMMTLYGIKAG